MAQGKGLEPGKYQPKEYSRRCLAKEKEEGREKDDSDSSPTIAQTELSPSNVYADKT